MVLDLTTPFKNFKGEQLTDPQGHPIYMKDVVIAGLTFSNPKEESLAERLRLYDKAMEVAKSKKFEFTDEELARIKKNVNLVYVSPVVVGQFSKLIEKSPK